MEVFVLHKVYPNGPEFGTDVILGIYDNFNKLHDSKTKAISFLNENDCWVIKVYKMNINAEISDEYHYNENINNDIS